MNTITSYKSFVLVLIALLILTGLSVFVATIDMGKINIWGALFMASIKSSLVLWFFMHLKYESRLIQYSFLGTIITLFGMISFVFWDIAFR